MIDFKNHWDNVYSKNDLNKLGWYEENPQPSLDLINSCNLNKDAAILDVGSGATTLIKNLIHNSYSNIFALDISRVALDRAKHLLSPEDAEKVKWIVDDVTNPEYLNQQGSIDLWHDRTVLHFLIEENQQKGYLETLKKVVRKEGFVIIAVFSLEGAKKCSGLDVKNYDHKMIEEYLGKEFKLLKHFPYLYQMPSGDIRPYIYTLFQRIDTRILYQTPNYIRITSE
jgi:SAM-dependent methyltransferase